MFSNSGLMASQYVSDFTIYIITWFNTIETFYQIITLFLPPYRVTPACHENFCIAHLGASVDKKGYFFNVCREQIHDSFPPLSNDIIKLDYLLTEGMNRKWERAGMSAVGLEKYKYVHQCILGRTHFNSEYL